MFAGQENSKASEANKKAESALKHIEAVDAYVKTLEAKVIDLTNQIAKLVEAITLKDEQTDKTKQKIEWLEMKANNAPKVSNHMNNRVTLIQEKPLQVNVLYREAKARPKPSTELDPKVRGALIKTIKKQLSEVSQ